MKSVAKRTVTVILSVILAVMCFVSCTKEKREASAVIEDIITYHGCYDTQADVKVNELLNELNDIDSKQGELWKNIMDYWKYANTDLTVNIDKLPDNLSDKNNLALVVLGFELNDDGTMKDELIGRLNVALACSKQYKNAYVICTGGGTAKNNKKVTEAGLMGGNSYLCEPSDDETL